RAESACDRHSRRSAVARCVTCGSPLCSECIVRTPVGFKCARCTGDRAGPAKRPATESPRGRRSWVALSAAGAVLALVAGYGLTRGGGDGGAGQRGAAGRGEESSPPAGEVPVRIVGAGGLGLGANLLIPRGTASPVPAVVIIPGFGPTDRDGVASPGAAPDVLYRDVAETLSGAGVASLRYDKRGRGASVLPAGTPLRFEDIVEDARGALDFLAERKGIDGRRVALVGHDEGGLIALRLAADDPRVRAVVLISTPGRRLAEVLADELRVTVPPPEGDRLAERVQAVAATLVAAGSLPPPQELPSPLQAVFPPGQEQYLRELFSFDPVAEARGVHAPVLLVRGGKDNGVSAADEEALLGALAGVAEAVVGEEAGHTLLVPTDLPSSGDDHDETFHAGAAAVATARDEQLLNRVGDWLAARLGTGLAGEVPVSAREFFFAPAEVRVQPGTYRIVLTNTGSVAHQLVVHRPDERDRPLAEMAALPAGRTRTLTVRLGGGLYEYACYLPGHFEAGMRGRIRVGE
ncbi:MAG: alpha/beta fold hydrolase, partial [Actinomycetota bacterium]|nr:alpha/beta fold hydrolase [Actinomycetota bacterium]